MNLGSQSSDKLGELPTDEQLMAEVISGRQEALQVLHRRLAPLVFHIACRSLDSSAAEEITQDVFLRVWQKASSFDPAKGSFRTWALQIAHHRVVNELRDRGRRPKIEADSENSLVDLSAHDSGPEEQVWAEYQRSTIQRALMELPQEQGQALRLAFFQDLTHEQVSDFLGVPLGTVKGRIRLGLVKLNSTLTALVASLVAVVGFSAYGWNRHRAALRLDEGALAMLTSSHMEPLRLEPISPVAEIEQGPHAMYRAERGRAVVVFTLSNVPVPNPGETYRLWRLSSGTWKALGEPAPDTQGRGRIIFEVPDLLWPEALRLSLEQQGSNNPTPVGRVVLAWPSSKGQKDDVKPR